MNTRGEPPCRGVSGTAVHGLGATPIRGGVHFAVFSEHAEAIELCLFDSQGKTEAARMAMRRGGDAIWHADVSGIGPGQRYGFRAHGPYRPSEGHRFNPHKLLLDPYARAVSGPVPAGDCMYGYRRDDPAADFSFDTRDNAALMPKCVVAEPDFDWAGDRRPRRSWEEMVIYECHVKGTTMRHSEIDPKLRGTYLGLSSEPMIRHLQSLGVTAVELLPVHHFADQRALLRRGLVNYWGYHPVAYFAPEARYARDAGGGQVAEFKQMVKQFHAAGFEVILDVVFNHTGEGDRLGRTLMFRGLDNAVYYRLKPGDAADYDNFTGCGNTLNVAHPRVRALALDCLRYWVAEMHVDGFRFDLATVLMREGDRVETHTALLDAIGSDPLLSKAKLIAEPWDLGPHGYQLGRFPSPWSEWNDQYRNTVRRFWRGDGGQLPELASRLAGSSDRFAGSDRGPAASINFVTCHDGFTLQDLVSYERKHNAANGEENRDGSDENFSRNWGVEGATERAEVNHARERVKRNFAAMLLFSRGVPMLNAGDELSRTQHGNNNAYCQDGPEFWLDWNLTPRSRAFLDFVRRIAAIRRQYPVFRRNAFFEGKAMGGAGLKDIAWLRPEGGEMSAADWHDGNRRAIGMLLHDGEPGSWGGGTLLLLLNGGESAIGFAIPRPNSSSWRVLLGTDESVEGGRTIAESEIALPASSFLLLGDELLG